MKWLLALLALSSCADPCVDGVCPNFDGTAPHPGPCESALQRTGVNGHPYSDHCTYTYDGALVATIECKQENEFGEASTSTTTWTYDAAGQPVTITSSLVPDGASSRWQLDADPVTYSEGLGAPATELEAYDRATFAFLPLVGSDVRAPRAELGLIRAAGETYTWSGSGSELTRTGSKGTTTTFQLDGRGRIVHSHTEYANARVDDVTWTFDGDRLRQTVTVTTQSSGTTRTSTRYSYDHAGNVVTSEGEAYAYGCW